MYDPTKPYKDDILEMIQSTWDTPHVIVTKGRYPAVARTHCHVNEIDHTDGIGTKGLLLWQRRNLGRGVLAGGVQDALAMNLNDLITVGAVPYKLQNHLILPEDDHAAILEIISALCAHCRQRKICVTGGETSIQNNIEGMELSLTVTGFVPDFYITKQNKAAIGDYVVGLPSSGPHSNGYTLLRRIMPNPPTTPTVIYEQPKVWYNSIVHLAGGAYTRLKEVCQDHQDIVLEFQSGDFWQYVWHEVKAHDALNRDENLDRQMYSTFNCGYGMVMTVPPESYRPECGHLIGHVVRGNKNVRIKSAFTGNEVTL
jgi:phosphoribosylformylglycinamidine cyclo-ligase